MNEWQPNTHYNKWDKVSYGSKEYIAQCDMLSTVSPDISSNWVLLPKEIKMPSEQYKKLRDWINYNSRNDSLVVNNYKTTDALNDLADLEDLAHPLEVISNMPVADTSMPVMQCDDPFRIGRPEAVKSLMEILDITTGDKVRILESLVLMYTKDKE